MIASWRSSLEVLISNCEQVHSQRDALQMFTFSDARTSLSQNSNMLVPVLGLSGKVLYDLNPYPILISSAFNMHVAV